MRILSFYNNTIHVSRTNSYILVQDDVLLEDYISFFQGDCVTNQKSYKRVFIDPELTFPRTLLAQASYQRSLSMEKADAIIISKDKWQSYEVELGYVLIPKEGEPLLVQESQIVSRDLSIYEIAQYFEADIKRCLISNSDISIFKDLYLYKDKLISFVNFLENYFNQLPKLDENTLGTIISYIKSSDDKIKKLGIDMCKSFNALEYLPYIMLILGTTSWEIDPHLSSSVYFKFFLELLDMTPSTLCKRMRYMDSVKESKYSYIQILRFARRLLDFKFCSKDCEDKVLNYLYLIRTGETRIIGQEDLDVIKCWEGYIYEQN